MRTRTVLASIGVGILVLAASGGDAGARGKHGTRARFDRVGDAATDGRHAADGRARLRVRDDGALLDCRFRRLDPAGDYALECDLPGADPVPFVTDRRGRARLRDLPLDAGAAADAIRLLVRDGAGDAVLETDLHHPGRDHRHGAHDAPADECGHHDESCQDGPGHDGAGDDGGHHDPAHHDPDHDPAHHDPAHHGGGTGDAPSDDPRDHHGDGASHP